MGRVGLNVCSSEIHGAAALGRALFSAGRLWRMAEAPGRWLRKGLAPRLSPDLRAVAVMSLILLFQRVVSVSAASRSRR